MKNNLRLPRVFVTDTPRFTAATRRSAATQKTCAFEVLESRQLLAITAFDTGTGALTIDFEPADSLVTIGNDGNLLTVNNTTDLDWSTAGVQSVGIDQLVQIRVDGKTGDSPYSRSLVVTGELTAGTAPLLTDFTASDLHRVTFDGDLNLAGQLTIDLVTVLNPTKILQTNSSQITVAGATELGVNDGTISLNRGTNDFVGPVSVSSSGENRWVFLSDTSVLELDQLTVAGSMRAHAATITDAPGSHIDVHRLWIKAGKISLGDHVGDEVVPRMLNFKSSGRVDISAKADFWLIGSSFSQFSRLNSSGGIFDAIRARTRIAGALQIDADRVTLGDSDADRFTAGSVSFLVDRWAHLEQDTDLLLAGASIASMVHLVSSGTISDQPVSSLRVNGHAHLEAAGDIVLGEDRTDLIELGSVQITNPIAATRITSDGNLQLAQTSYANQLFLDVTGHLTDRGSAQTTVVQDAVLVVSGSIELGDKNNDLFNTGDLTFRAGQTAAISEDSGVRLAGDNTAAGLQLAADGAITNRWSASVEISGDAEFDAAQIKLGVYPSDELLAGRYNFNSNRQVALVSDTDIRVFGENSAQGLVLQSAEGNIADVAGSSVVVKNRALLAGTTIRFGLQSDFRSSSLTLQATGNVTVRQTADMMLAGQNRANSFRLITPGQISNAEGTTLEARRRLDLAAGSTDLGSFESDDFSMSSLRFNVGDRMALRSRGDVLMVLDNFAKSLDLAAEGAIGDQPNSQVIIEQFASFTGTDVILGDSDNDCFDVMSNNWAVNASGVQNVSEGC